MALFLVAVLEHEINRRVAGFELVGGSAAHQFERVDIWLLLGATQHTDRQSTHQYGYSPTHTLSRWLHRFYAQPHGNSTPIRRNATRLSCFFDKLIRGTGKTRSCSIFQLSVGSGGGSGALVQDVREQAALLVSGGDCSPRVANSHPAGIDL